MLKLKSYQQKIYELGVYFINETPSDINSLRVIEAETVLNEMYIEAASGNYTSDIQAAITAAIGDAGYMSNIVKNSDEPPPPTYFSLSKELGSKFSKLNVLLGSLED